ncbi:M48 family metalloprotease [Dyadobacter sp. 3J3]|uniref:M48 family metalloprotease n=1 Tax=Dyadobacter sp. 3J3 TaxID=2606600 RepID=UPI0013595A5A|nr:M48 family metalloprotease [Dyadobacter sp. 3J3]
MLSNQIRKYTTGIILIVIVVLISVLLFFRKTQLNPVTGKKQHINLTHQQEIELGLECAPDMAARFGGLYSNTDIKNKVKVIGQKLVAVRQVSKSPYQFDFHILADSQMVNTFSFPGGQIFITRGLLKLLKTDDEIAIILSHEIGHVMGRHTTEKLSGFDILEKFKDSTHVITNYSPNQINSYITDLLKITFDSEEESEADELALKYMVEAGYNPKAFPEILEKLSGKSEIPGAEDFLNRHPVPENRIENLKSTIIKYHKRK